MTVLELSQAGRRFRVDMSRVHDLSIGLQFDGPQPSFFGAAAAHAEPLRASDFYGAVAAGGSCNCATYTLTPHCNGTHTECVGHVTREKMGIREIAPVSLLTARVVSVQPCAVPYSVRSGPGGHDAKLERLPAADAPYAAADSVITRKLLEAAEAAGDSGLPDYAALIVRTLPNSPDKARRRYSASDATPYFTVAAMQWMVEKNIHHLIVDLPSVDRAEDGGRLLGHRVFWGLPPGSVARAQATRADATITELAYIADSVADGMYLLNLQVAPFETDAAPSRPLLYPLSVTS